jgi:hypothetical protein
MVLAQTQHTHLTDLLFSLSFALRRPLSTQPMIEVIAPATLSEGYKFDAQVGDRTFQVTVPPGGVEGGQRFTVPMPSAGEGGDGGFGNMMVPKINVPVGHWKDGICDCLTYGPCHNHCLMAFFCPLRKLTCISYFSMQSAMGSALLPVSY